MTASLSSPPPSVLGLALTLDPACSALESTLHALRSRSGLILEECATPFAAIALETADPRADHAWLEALPGVVAVDVVFVEVVGDDAAPNGAGSPRRRRRSRDPLDDSPLPPCGPVPAADPDFPAF